MSPSRRIATLLALAMALSLVVAPAAHAAAPEPNASTLPSTIDLPDGFQPEGIDSAGNQLYVGSLAGGAIWRGSVRTGKGDILVPAVEGRVAVGIFLDGLGRLWVAGGDTKTIRVYEAQSGELLETYTFPTTGFINDLTLTHNRVYGTDSVNQQLAVIPLGEHGALPAASSATTMALKGEISYSEGFNANGITTKAGWLILVQTNEGLLFRVNPETGFARAIDTGGYQVANGDGIEVRGRLLYVIRNEDNLVAVLTLTSRLLHATLLGEITSPELDVPTTGTFAAGKFWVVNARFGTTDPQPAEYWITRLPMVRA